MYVSFAYFMANLSTDIVFQALSIFKIVILLLIVIAGVFSTVNLFILSLHILEKMGRTQWKNPCP